MNSVAQMFELALQHHRAGNLQQAKLLYRQILQVDSGHADALHMLGVLAHQVGRNDLAIEYIQRSLRLNPGNPDLRKLQELRGTLRTRMLASPLMDGKRFARNMEHAYRQMWHRWCRKSG
jgi:tetratricopeptide (TPR) repeat protein